MEDSTGSDIELGELRLLIPDDLDGSTADLRGWLMSGPPTAPWHVHPEAPSRGMGAETGIGLALESATAVVEVGSRVRLWLKRRDPRPARLAATAIVQFDGKPYRLTVRLDPVEAGDGRPA